jgi:hypothetical protein
MNSPSPYTNPLPSDTVNVCVNVPDKVKAIWVREAKERGLNIGEYLVCSTLGYHQMNDRPAMEEIQQAMSERKPKLATFWANISAVLFPNQFRATLR